jgi:hypothetical protein
VPPLSPAKELAGFIAKFDPALAARIRGCRQVLRRRLRGAHELVYDNYNFFVIGYCTTERPSSCIVSLIANRNGVALSFYYGATLPDPQAILLGNGNQNRFIRLASPKALTEAALASVIRAAIAEADPPLRPSNRSRLIIRAVASKHRPRR